jgi:hypothetical protein
MRRGADPASSYIGVQLSGRPYPIPCACLNVIEVDTFLL